MKLNLIYRSGFILLLTVILAGCGTSPLTRNPDQAEKYFPPTVITPNHTPLSTYLATNTPTPIATLEPEKAAEQIHALLMDSADCAAPCFWGIVPGETTALEAKDFFHYNGLETKVITFKGQEYFDINYDLKSGMSININLEIKNDIVVTVNIGISISSSINGTFQEITAYSPKTLVERYGTPNYVGIAADWAPGPLFSLIIYYDDMDLIVEYWGVNIIPAERGVSQICPLTTKFDGVSLWFGENPRHPPQTISLEDVTSLTVDEFARLMIGEPEKACFLFNGNAYKIER